MKKLLFGLMIVTMAHAADKEYIPTAFIQKDKLQTNVVAKTDVGEIVLNLEACNPPSHPEFKYTAFSSDGNDIHQGCWYEDHDIINVWWWQEQDSLVATYADYYFKARK